MSTPKQSKLKKTLERTDVRIAADERNIEIETLDVPQFLVRLVGRDNAKRFSVPVVIRNRHD